MMRTWLTIALALVVAGCGGGGDSTSSSSSSSSSKAKDDESSTAVTTKHEAEEPKPPTEDDLPIYVSSPSGFQSVYRTFQLKGRATAHEGTVAWEILDARDEPLARGTVQASCGAPCRGRFAAKVDVSKVTPGSWELHVFQPPVDDGDPPRVHDFVVPITITTGPIDPSDPGPDAPPPGGVPTS